MRCISAVNRPLSWLVGVLLLAFGLRVVFMLLAGVNAPLTGDELAYQQIAENVAAGRGFFQNNNPFFPGQILYAWQAPLYPLALGVLYKIFGVNILIAKLFGIVISTATVYVIYDLTFHVSRLMQANNEHSPHAPRSALLPFVAAFLIAIYPGFLTHAHLVLSETLFIFLLLLAFALVARALSIQNLAAGNVTAANVEISYSVQNDNRTWLWIFFAGAVWGMATLTRGITLYFTPLFALWMAWGLWRAPDAHKDSLRRATLVALLFVVGTALVIAPWTVRNYFQFHQLVLLETKGGVNLWLGNSPYTPNDFIRNVWKVGVREPMLAALPSDELARDRAAYALASNYIRAEPLTFLARVPIKFADFWGMERSLVDVAEATTRGEGWNSPAKIGADALALLVYVGVMLAGIGGFVFAPNERWKILFGGFTLYFLAAHLVIFGDGRFHLPLIPFFALYAAWFWTRRATLSITRARTIGAIVLSLLLCAVWLRELFAAWQILRG